MNARQTQEPTLHPRKTISGKMIAFCLMAGLVAILYFSGRLDPMLSGAGLNWGPCVKNGFGATFCGQAAKNYCQELNASGINRINLNSANVCRGIR